MQVPQKILHLSSFLEWPIHNGLNLLRVYKYALIWVNVAQIMNLIFIKVTLAQLCIQLMLLEQLQCQPQMLFMLFLILRINKNVIKENKNKLIQIPAEDTIHKAHKCSRWICETKWYHYKLIVSTPYSKGCLMNISSQSWKIPLLLSFDKKGHQF